MTSSADLSTSPGSSQPTRTRIAVLYGGRSSEHSISCVSAAAIIQHLDPQKYEVIPVGITRAGQWVVGATDPAELTIKDRHLPQVLDRDVIQLSLDPTRPGTLTFVTGPRMGEVFATVDVIFPVLHGRFGEDGTIQGLCELAGVPYVGTGVMSSAASMDKEYTKKIASAAGLPIGREVVLRARNTHATGGEGTTSLTSGGEGTTPNPTLTDADKAYLGLPVFVKPARGGSSIGISKVDRWEDLDEAISLAREYDSKVIVEAMIHGVEVECGVLQYPDGHVVASLPAQLADTESGEEGFYGFDTKYLDNVVTAQIPAAVGEETLSHIQELAVETFHALDCDGLSRVDFFVTERGPVLNEINTMPGFTPISMYPQMFAASGVPYAELLDILVQRALVKG